MSSPNASSSVLPPSTEEEEVDVIIRTFMQEQARNQGQRGRRNSVVDNIFRGEGQHLQETSSSPANADVGRQLAVIAVQLDEHFYHEETAQNIEVLERHPNNRSSNLGRIIQGVFQHGITAGHVMSLLIFGYRYINYLVNKGIDGAEGVCREIMSSIISYIRQYVITWIKSIGGWNGFLDEVKQYVKEQVEKLNNQITQQNLFVGFLVVVTAVNLGALYYRYK